MKTARSRNHSKTEDLLVSLAESVGSTLGTIAAKAGAAQKALTHGEIAARLAREGRNIARRSKKLISGAKKARKKVTRPPGKRTVARQAGKAVRKTRTASRRARTKATRATTGAAAAVRRATRTRSRSKL